MRVVIRRRHRRGNARLAQGTLGRRAAGVALVLQWLVFVALAICVWRWAFDLRWVSIFLVADGFLARWQIWFASAAVLQLLASLIGRYARSLPPAEENGPLGSSLKKNAA